MRRRLSASLIPLAGLLGAALGLAACERHIEEPVPVRPLDPTSLKGAEPPKGQEIPEAKKARCVRQSPAVPARKPGPSPDPRCPPDNEEFPPRLRTGKIVFPDAKGGALTTTVEIADNDHDRMRGLMFRKSMADDRGMIFDFAEKDDHTFWMHNTCIPLDMLFIDDDGTIVGIEESTPTMSDNTFSVGCESKYVLELNAGWTRSHGVVAGQKVKLEGI